MYNVHVVLGPDGSAAAADIHVQVGDVGELARKAVRVVMFRRIDIVVVVGYKKGENLPCEIAGILYSS